MGDRRSPRAGGRPRRRGLGPRAPRLRRRRCHRRPRRHRHRAAVANCAVAQTPLLLLGGAQPLVQAEQGALQELDQLALFKPITKWAAVCTRAERIPEYVAAAFRHALAQPRGPVYLELPTDVLFEEAVPDRPPAPSRSPARTFADPAQVATALAPTPYERLAEAFGGYGERVERPGEIGPAVERALAAGVPAVVNIMLNPYAMQGHPLSRDVTIALREAEVSAPAGSPRPPTRSPPGFSTPLPAGRRRGAMRRSPTTCRGAEPRRPVRPEPPEPRAATATTSATRSAMPSRRANMCSLW